MEVIPRVLIVLFVDIASRSLSSVISSNFSGSQILILVSREQVAIKLEFVSSLQPVIKPP